MASDITITVTADPQQAVQGLEQVKKAGDALADSAKKVQQASDAAATDSLNSISAVSREASQVIAQTNGSIASVGSGIKLAANEAAKVSGALGKSIPVVSQLGSAIASAITGPVGAVSAAIGLAIAGIMKMIQAAQQQVALLKMSAESRTNAVYDALMQGRQDYAEQLQVLAQVREINRYAESNKLTADQLSEFRQLASQIGIAERDVGDRGIRSGKLGEAARSIRQQREFYSRQEYQDYVTDFGVQLLNSINDSKLSEADKAKLGLMTTSDRVKTITQAARMGQGNSTEEYKAWQDLAAMSKQYSAVVSSYSRDRLLGRDQSTLNGIIADKFKSAAEKAAKDAASGSSGPAPVGSWAWQQEQDKLAQKELDAQQARLDRADKFLEGLDRQIAMNELIAQGKEKEAFLLRNRLQQEDILGQKLTEAQIAEVDARSERLYALQHPESPELAPEAPAARAALRASGHPASQYTMPLDSLQRIGANLRGGASSPEKLVMDQQLQTTKEILNVLNVVVSGPRSAGLFFP